MARQNSQPGNSSNRGFAAMDAERQREIASRGGRAAHAQGTAHEFSSEEARAAGRKGGQAAHERGNAHEFTSEEARAAGRKGGQASQGSRNRIQQQVAQNDSQQPMRQGNPDDSESSPQQGGYSNPGNIQQGYVNDDMEKDQD
jgi:general stress protein YciG